MTQNNIESARLVEAMTQRMASTVAEVAPWFVEQMPGSYFRDLPSALIEDHLSAIIAARSSGQPLALTLKSNGDDLWTFINAQDKPGLLASLVDQLPPDRALNSARIYTAIDGQLVVDVFSYRKAHPYDPTDSDQRAAFDRFVDALPEYAPQLSAGEVSAHCHRCRGEYLLAATPNRFFKHLALYNAVAGTEDVSTHVETVSSVSGLSRFILAAANADPTSLFRRTARYLSTRGVDIHRAYLEAMGPPEGPAVSMISLVLVDPEGRAVQQDDALWTEIKSDLARLPWLDRRVLQRANEHHAYPGLSLVKCEILIALADLVHQRLGPIDPYQFSRDRVEEQVFQNLEMSLSIAHLVATRFIESSVDGPSYEASLASVRERSPAATGDATGRRVMEVLCSAASSIRSSNLDRSSRYALGMVIDPGFLHGELTDSRPHPFGVLYFFGRMFHGFHVRFRSIARGGLRVVRPRKSVAYFNETNRLYSEAWGLAHAQQLKNKDIPEGGAKGVILASPEASTERVVKALGDTLLDLNLAQPSSGDHLIYLGPDENITDSLILWLVQRAAERGHPVPNAFMSSKPGAGINHKEYGVTSEGVVVFLEAALKARGMDPRSRPFSVKMTGGPDGDVAGNAIRIMHREFGQNPRIVAVADGSGSAEDPQGLALDELLRLVDAGLGIAHFSRSALSAAGRVLAVDDEGGLEARNTVHNRVNADAFIPCGGRPSAVNGDNWRDFLAKDGQASAGVVVEGANLFFTEDARAALAENAQVLFVKDSSANKCGVICSSFEIAASLLIDEASFLSIKEAFVAEVLERLRGLAKKEAAVLFSQYQRRPDIPLSQVSVRLSDAINRTKDAIIDRLSELGPADVARADALVDHHLPNSLRRAAGAESIASLPKAYFHRVIASVLAGEIVYREGIDYLNDIHAEQLGALAIQYLRHIEETRQLIDALSETDLADRDRIIQLLEHGGVRASMCLDG